MTIASLRSYQIDTEDVEYLRHKDKPLLARLFKPRGPGPFPLVVELHGGAWCRGDRLMDSAINEPLAKSGVVVAALDFRLPPDGVYPGPMADINYAIRWLKQRAGELRIRPDRVATMGLSSGGHQAMLAAMRPRDPRYTVLPLAGQTENIDASIRSAILCWPVIDPLGRFEHGKKIKAAGKPYSEKVDRWLQAEEFWLTEAAMIEGSPVGALERGEKVDMPSVLYIQGAADVAHPRPHVDRFVECYRKAGGRVELQLYEGMGEGFLIRKPDLPVSVQAINKIIEFVHAELG